MSGGRLVTCIVICGAVVACGAGNTTRSAAPTSSGAVDVLRELSRLPDGFSVRPRHSWRSPVRPADERCRTMLAAPAGHPPERGLRTHAAVALRGNRVGESGGVSVAVYSGGHSSTAFGELSRALARCEEVVPRKGDTRLTVKRLTGERIDDIGDDVAAARLRGKLNGYPYEMRVIFVRSGTMLISVAHAGMGRLDPHRTEQLVRAVADEVPGRAE